MAGGDSGEKITLRTLKFCSDEETMPVRYREGDGLCGRGTVPTCAAAQPHLFSRGTGFSSGGKQGADLPGLYKVIGRAMVGIAGDSISRNGSIHTRQSVAPALASRSNINSIARHRGAGVNGGGRHQQTGVAPYFAAKKRLDVV